MGMLEKGIKPCASLLCSRARHCVGTPLSGARYGTRHRCPQRCRVLLLIWQRLRLHVRSIPIEMQILISPSLAHKRLFCSDDLKLKCEINHGLIEGPLSFCAQDVSVFSCCSWTFKENSLPSLSCFLLSLHHHFSPFCFLLTK